jgi:glycosyltransferase involved in cell wall biosynthesis
VNVLQLISSGGMYGAEAVILNLSHVLERGGDRSVIASFANASQQMHERAQAEGLTSVLVPCAGQVSPETVRGIRALVEEHSIDVVHAHGYKSDLYSWAALRGGPVPLVSTCHTWYDNDVAVRVYGALDRWALRSFSRVVAVSAEVEQRLLGSGVRAERVRRIRNGIDHEKFTAVAASRGAASGEPLRVGLVGRLSREKGVDVFIDAAAEVLRSLPEVEFVVVGEGPDRGQLEEQIRQRGIGAKLRLLGHQEAMLPVYAGLDLMVSASRQEGLPVALLEGMASGLPLVATTAGEVPTLVMPGETGLLVPTGDAHALASAMLRVLRDEGERLAFGRNARARIVQHYSAERMSAEYREVYQEAMSATERRA